MPADPWDAEGRPHPVLTETAVCREDKAAGLCGLALKALSPVISWRTVSRPPVVSLYVALAALLTFAPSSPSFWKPTLTPRLGWKPLLQAPFPALDHSPYDCVLLW